jgi:hypothetical protein
VLQNCPDNSASIVEVHSLSGHPVQTWTASRSVNWLPDKFSSLLIKHYSILRQLLVERKQPVHTPGG